MTADNLALQLRTRLDEQGNVQLVAKHPVKNAFCAVQVLSYDDETRTLNLALREGEENHYLETLLNTLSRTDAIRALRLLVFVNGIAGGFEVTRLSEKRHFRNKYGEHSAVLLELSSEVAA